MIQDPSSPKVSVIVPTIGRPESLRRLLDSLAQQSFRVHEVVVADGSGGSESEALCWESRWEQLGLVVKHISVSPPNAVRQRVAAIAQASGELLLFLDDDIVLEANCVEQMMGLISDDQSVVGVFGDFNNQPWPNPTRAWHFYLRHILRMKENEWQGRVVGPLLRFGYNPPPAHAMPIEWMGTCNTMVRRSAYEQVGGFSDFFLHRCTSNEDVDLGLKICRLGRVLFCPDARMGHFHAPGGRVSAMVAAEDELYNRYMIMRHTQRSPAYAAYGLALLYFLVETASSVLGCLKRRQIDGLVGRTFGRSRALIRILFSARTPN